MTPKWAHLSDYQAAVSSEPEHLAELAQLARKGDIAAFEKIVRDLQGKVRAYCRRSLASSDLGDDAAQETFIRMWKGFASFAGGSLTAWTFRIARNTCIGLIRKQKNVPVPVGEIAGVESRSDQESLKTEIRAGIDGLTDKHRSVILLREAGLSYEEIAAALECPVGTVRSRINSARRILALKLSPSAMKVGER